MTIVFRSLARTLMAITIALGVTPPAVSLFELLRRPTVRIVVITNRRQVEYSKLFGAVDDAD
jgi:hypothetical protein